jgi:anti-sigma regulatory factor (Ser/Thr protein kinase)
MVCLIDVSLPFESTAPWRARQEIRDRMTDHVPEALLADLLLVVSELVTNAIRHAQSPCTLLVDLEDDAVVVEVHDLGGWPRRATFGRPDPPRGLGLVQSVSARWGVERTDAGKCVWVELSLPPVEQRRTERCSSR